MIWTCFYFRDGLGKVHARRSPTCPPGMTPHSGILADGERLHVGMMVQDAAHSGSVMMFDRRTVIADALAACPASTRDLQHKAALAMIDAEGASNAVEFESAMSNLQSLAAQYGMHGRDRDASTQAACDRAAKALSSKAEVLSLMRAEGVRA